MSVQFIELFNRVFRLEIKPDTPGWARRVFTLELESGPALELYEADQLAAALRDELERRGQTIRRISYLGATSHE